VVSSLKRSRPSSPHSSSESGPPAERIRIISSYDVHTLSPMATVSIYHAKATLLHMLHETLASNVERYFMHLHPLSPILERRTVQSRFNHRQHLVDESFGALILSIGCIAQLIPSSRSESGDVSASAGCTDDMAREALSLASSVRLHDTPTLDDISSSVITAAYLKATDRTKGAFLQTRQSLGMAEVLQLSIGGSYSRWTEDEQNTAMCLFWGMSVAER
jgi:hypothetical protein